MPLDPSTGAVLDAGAARVGPGDQIDAELRRARDLLAVRVEDAPELGHRLRPPAGRLRTAPLEVHRREGRHPGRTLVSHPAQQRVGHEEPVFDRVHSGGQSDVDARLAAGRQDVADPLALVGPAGDGRRRSVLEVVGVGHHGQRPPPVLGERLELRRLAHGRTVPKAPARHPDRQARGPPQRRIDDEGHVDDDRIGAPTLQEQVRDIAETHAGVAVVTCMDSRIDPLGMLGLKPGDAKIFRNPGGRVTGNALEALVLAVHLLNVDRILIVPHTRCAGR